MKYSIKSFWPNNIGRYENPNHYEIKDGILNFIDQYIKNNQTRKGGENNNLFESSYDLHKSDDKNIKKLVKFISESFFHMAIYSNKDFYNNQKLNCRLHDMWFIKYLKGGFVMPHDHGKCSWCCVYYLQSGADSDLENGSTYFYRPSRYPRENKDFGSKYNIDMIKMQAIEGTMLIWPNHLLHGSLPYKGKLERIIFSANASVYEVNDKGESIDS